MMGIWRYGEDSPPNVCTHKTHCRPQVGILVNELRAAGGNVYELIDYTNYLKPEIGYQLRSMKFQMYKISRISSVEWSLTSHEDISRCGGVALDSPHLRRCDIIKSQCKSKLIMSAMLRGSKYHIATRRNIRHGSGVRSHHIVSHLIQSVRVILP